MNVKQVYKCVFLFFLLCFLLTDYGFAQKKSRYSAPNKSKKQQRIANDPFENTQWWLGAKFGANLTQAVPSDRFSAFSNTLNTDPAFYDKEYENFNKVGAQSGVVITYFRKGFSFSFQPNYRRQRFIYTNDYRWVDETNTANVLELAYEQDNKLDYIEFPVLVKYDLMQSNFRPFVQLGAYYATLVNANKSVVLTTTDYASGAASQTVNPPIIVGAKDLFINTSLGLIGGVGVNWNLGNFRLTFDVNYKYGLNNIASQANRYSDNRLAGIGEALDNIKLRTIEFSFHVSFPLNYVFGTDYSAVD